LYFITVSIAQICVDMAKGILITHELGIPSEYIFHTYSNCYQFHGTRQNAL